LSNENSQTERLRSRLKSALILGWALFSVTVLAVTAFGFLTARSSFTTCSPPACGSNHGGDAASLTALVIFLLDLTVTIVFLAFGVRSLRSLRSLGRNGADSSLIKAARRVRKSSIIQLSILITPVVSFVLFYLVIVVVTFWR